MILQLGNLGIEVFDLLNEDLVDETTFKTVDYTSVREYYVFRKVPFRSF